MVGFVCGQALSRAPGAVFGRTVIIVSLIGTLKQFSLALVLQRIEVHEKTGLFKIQQGTRWVDLYLREGRLMCICQQYVNIPLGERLVNSGVISAQALQDATLATGDALPNETRLVITLMDLGYVEREELRAWATQEAVQVLQELLTWADGELYFEEEVPPPAGRLLVSLSLATLLSAIAPAVSPRATLVVSDQQPVLTGSSPANLTAPTDASQRAQTVLDQETVRTEIVNAPTLFETTQFLKEAETQYPSLAPDLSDSLLSALPDDPDSLLSQSFQQAPAQPDVDPLIPIPVTAPELPGWIDTSFLLPDTILVPVDLSVLRGSNQRVQITPAQWRLLTRIDGCTTLQTACMQLGLAPDRICQLAGELLALGLVSVAGPWAMNDAVSPASRQIISRVNGYVAPVAVATTAIAEPEMQSQWGNGDNGAKFVPGRGWVTGSQPRLSLQPGSPSGPLYATNNVYAAGMY